MMLASIDSAQQALTARPTRGAFNCMSGPHLLVLPTGRLLSLAVVPRYTGRLSDAITGAGILVELT